MQDLGWKRRWGSCPAARRGARAGLTPASASNKLSCLLEMLHSKQLRSIKMLIDSNHGIYRGENPGPGNDVHGELDHRPGIREQPESFSSEAAGSAARPTSASPRKLTSGPYEKLVAVGPGCVKMAPYQRQSLARQ